MGNHDKALVGVAREPQNQVQFDGHRPRENALGPYTEFIWKHDPRHLGFLLARYKFVAKMFEGKASVFEVGCGDAFGMRVVAQSVAYVHGIDAEPLLIADNCRRLTGVVCSFACFDITEHAPAESGYEGAYSLDVLEHVSADREERFFSNICRGLRRNGALIIGTPNASAAAYASKASAEGHVNLKTHSELRTLMGRYFESVFMFGMNDEVLHCGYGAMSHYLLALGVGVR